MMLLWHILEMIARGKRLCNKNKERKYTLFVSKQTEFDRKPYTMYFWGAKIKKKPKECFLCV